MAATAQQRLQNVYDNWCMVLVLIDLAVASPTQANIDAAVLATTGNGGILPRITGSNGEESIDWTGLRSTIVDKMFLLEQAIQRASGPFDIRTRTYT